MAMRAVEESNIKIGKMLKSAREQRKVLQADLCEATGLTKNHISVIERGASKASIKMLLGYCDKLDVTPNDILGYEESKIIPELKEVLLSIDENQQQKILDIVKLILRIVGHKSQGVTEVVYTHFEITELLDAINKI